MPHPIRNWRMPFCELHPDLKKEVQALRKRRPDGSHFCMIHPDLVESHNKNIFNHAQLEAFRQAVEDVKIELNMNAIIDTTSMRTPDGRGILIVELVDHERSLGTLPEVYPTDPEAEEHIGIIVDEKGKTKDPNITTTPTEEDIIQ